MQFGTIQHELYRTNFYLPGAIFKLVNTLYIHREHENYLQRINTRIKELIMVTKVQRQQVAQQLKQAKVVSKNMSKESKEMQTVIGDLLKDCHDNEGLEFLRPYVSANGSKKQRKVFEELERFLNGGKTVKEIENAKQIKYHLAAIENAESVKDLELLQNEFGSFMGSKEITTAIANKKADLNFVADFEKGLRAERLEGLEKTFGEAVPNKEGFFFKNPAPNPKGMSGSELFKKYGKDIKGIQKSGVCEADKLAEIAILKNEKASLTKALEEKTKEANNLFWEKMDLGNQVKQQSDKILQQTDEIGRLEGNMSKISKFGHDLIAKNKDLVTKAKRWGIVAGVAAIGIGVALYFIGRSNKKKAVAAEQAKTAQAEKEQQTMQQQLEDERTRIAELERELEEAQRASAAQGTVETPETENTPVENKGSFNVFVRNAKEGDNPWDFCREQLEIELGRKPLRQEVLDAQRAFRAEFNIPLEEDNYTAIIPVGTPLYWRAK